MARLKLVPEIKKPKPSSTPLKLKKLRKYNQYELDRFLKRINFFGLAYGVYVAGHYQIDPKTGKSNLYFHARIGCRDVYDRRKSAHIGENFDSLPLPKGKYVSEKYLLNHLREMIIRNLMHEVDESFHVDGHKVFNPHTRTGRSRLWW